MRTIPAGEFKAKCLAIMDEVQARGETIVITKRGKPIVRLMPLESASIVEPRPIFGAMRGMGTVVGDIVGSLYSDEEWQRMEDENFAVFSGEKPA